MKLSKIGDLNLQKFKTEIYATENVKAILKKHDLSLSKLIPHAWTFYDAELLEVTDENNDGKIDEAFGKQFKISYFMPKESEIIRELEKQALIISKLSLNAIEIKYIVTKE